MANGSKGDAAVPFYYSHVPKNVLLLVLSAVLAPISAALVLLGLAVTKLHGERNATFTKEDKSHVAATRRRKTILVTGVSMTKGLTIARNLAQHTPHRIIGADISALSPGRFSTAISKYYRLETPSGDDAEPYIDSVLSIVHKEKVDLWISCSSVVAAVEDGQVVRIAEKQARERGRPFEAIQFHEDVVEKFHEKDKFIEYIESLDLPTPESHRCTNAGEALDVLMRELHRTPTKSKQDSRRKFIMKPIGVDDKARNNMMTLLPFQTPKETAEYIHSLNISKDNPFQLQQFIKGNEYCTHALVVRGKVKAFTSCPSLELLMHYKPLPPSSPLSQKMLEFTERVCEDGGETFTGHLSFDFLVEDDDKGYDAKFYPIECNPRAHTAVVLFEQTPEMADAYLSVFNSPASRSSKTEAGPPVFPGTPTYSYYWVGHDLVSFIILPFLNVLFGTMSFQQATDEFFTFFKHVTLWKDGTYTFEDPLPFFVLYHVYWPAKFLEALRTGKGWSRINVSTTKMFEE